MGPEALRTTVYLINLSPSKAIRLEVPQSLWSRKEPTYNRLHLFECEAYTFIPREKRTKLAPHSTKCTFLGYGTDGEFGYRLWDPKNRKLIWSSDVVSNEDSILSRNQQKIVGKNVSFKIDTDVIEGPTHQTKLALRQTVEDNILSDPPAESELEKGPLDELNLTRILTRGERNIVPIAQKGTYPSANRS